MLTNDLNKSGWIIFAGAAPTPDTLGIQVVHRSVADANHEIGCGNTTQNLRLEEKQNYEIIMISRLVMKERQFLPCHHPGHLYHVQKNNSKLIPETNSFSCLIAAACIRLLKAAVSNMWPARGSNAAREHQEKWRF